MLTRESLEAVSKKAQAEERAASFFFLLRKDPESSDEGDIPYELQRARMDEGIAKEFTEVLTKLLGRLAASKTLKFVEFDPYSIAERNRAEVWAIANVPALDRLVREMESPTKVEDAALGNDLFEDVAAYAVFLHVPGVRLAYFRNFQPSKVIRAGGLKAFFQKDTLTQISKPVFNFDEQADALVVGDDVLILQKTLFEQMFDLVRTLYTPMADKAIEQLSTLGLIDNVNGLGEACKQDERKQKKLADIYQNMPLKQFDLAKLSQMKADWSVDVDLTSSGQIKFEPQKAWNILKIMDDDYLSSPMTEQLYEVQSKRKVPRRVAAAPPRKRPSVAKASRKRAPIAP